MAREMTSLCICSRLEGANVRGCGRDASCTRREAVHLFLDAVVRATLVATTAWDAWPLLTSAPTAAPRRTSIAALMDATAIRDGPVPAPPEPQHPICDHGRGHLMFRSAVVIRPRKWSDLLLR